MNVRRQLVKDKDGNVTVALVATCPECGGDKFQILVIEGHNHLMCCQCDTSFCQNGTCGEPENKA